MFAKEIYIKRRDQLRKKIKSGILLFPGNVDSPMNYMANPYHFRQDSTFLYYWGQDIPGLFAIIDLDEDKEMIFGDDFTVDDIVWMGPQPTVKELGKIVGVKKTGSLANLSELIGSAQNKKRKIHYLPQYRGENIIKLEQLLGIKAEFIPKYVSVEFIKAVVAQRSLKSSEEVKQIESALKISYEMQTLAMKHTQPDMYEREVAGLMEGIALQMGKGLSFPTIFSIHGETLHNHGYDNLMKAGDIAVNDSGAESLLHYASDITRTIPVSGKFTSKQKEIYQIVLDAQLEAIKAMKPGVKFREVHLIAARVIAKGLKQLGFLKGKTGEIVAAGAHALFFPHGLGHMLGLDVHDMEILGEEYVGYDEKTKRSDQFGLAYLRMGKELKPGHVMTVEPGIYFIPELIDLWKKEKKFTNFIDYGKVEKYRKFGGIRIEDDVLITKDGHRVLGRPIPKTIVEVETMCGG
jgi:Xaa-Pro dipeptidase